MLEYSENIGKKVAKLASGKPFKSRLKVNTVKGIIEHPILEISAYTFEEDESYVECRRCTVVDEETIQRLQLEKQPC